VEVEVEVGVEVEVEVEVVEVVEAVAGARTRPGWREGCCTGSRSQ